MEGPHLPELMRMTREQWDAWTRGTAVRWAGYAGFRRNVAVALGNWSAAEVTEGNWLATVAEPPAPAVAALTAALEDEDRLVREHAEWALERALS